ncbi:MAG: SRPBCC family protein [Leptospiraceae bacterium]|nr:SRPBCC family protein [Leptospiraceae bacterium]
MQSKQLVRTQTFPPQYSLEQIFAFFSDAGNLQAITPANLQFQFLTPLPVTMQPGALIDYRIRIHGVLVRWRTRIDIWEPPYRFVDSQIKGPYKVWRHEHLFEAGPQGVRMTDSVTYHPGWGPLAGLICALYVTPQVERIFDYRLQKLAGLFAD